MASSKEEPAPTSRKKRKKKQWIDKLYKGLEIASDAADILVHVRAKPRALDFASIGLKVVQSYKRHAEDEDKKDRDDFFEEEGWEFVDLWDYKMAIYRITMRDVFPQERMDDCKNDKRKDIVIDMYGLQVGWHISDTSVYGPYVATKEDSDRAFHIFGRAIWEFIGTGACEIVAKKATMYDYTREIAFRPDNLKDDVYESDAAKDVLRRSKAFIEAGYNRSIILYGPPGSGKSCAMRYVARHLGKHSLRISVNDLGNLYSNDIAMAIHLLQPDVLIVDDFDRLFKPDSLLQNLEQFNTNIKLFMASVNHIDSLDRAVIRPGRFDDIIPLTTIDKDIQDKLIGPDVPRDVANKLRKMPVAYIADFHKRKEVLGVEEAIKGVEDLQDRIVEVVDGRRRRRTKKKATKKKTKKKATKRRARKKPVKEVEVEVTTNKSKED